MPFTHKIGVNYTNDAGTIASTVETLTGGEEVGLDVNVPPSTTDQLYPLGVTAVDILSMTIYSLNALVIKTYLGGVLKQTINLAAGQQDIWTTNSSFTCPITSDFDHVKVTNSDPSVTARLRARFLMIGIGS